MKIFSRFHSILRFGTMLCCMACFAQTPTTIYLVRHAEKYEQGADPRLKPEGVIRANALRNILKDVKLAAIITSDATRTKETAQPTAKAKRLKPKAIDAGDSNYVKNVVDEINHFPGESVLVVSHSDAILEICEELGVPNTEDIKEIGETEFDRFFIIQKTPGSEDANLMQLRYFAYNSWYTAPRPY